jgi:hypothetical protein
MGEEDVVIWEHVYRCVVVRCSLFLHVWQAA